MNCLFDCILATWKGAVARLGALALLLMLAPGWLGGQYVPFSVKARTRYSTSGAVGYQTIDDIKYYQLRIIQELSYKKFGLGLDLDFLFDMDGSLRKEDWDDLQDALDKFYYVRYGDEGDPFYAHLGGFPSLTIGNGLVMQRYSNMRLYPQMRNAGLMLGANPDLPWQPSFELFSSDLKRNEILSFSARCRPWPDTSRVWLDKLVVGASVAVDRNQYGNLKYLVGEDAEIAAQELDRNSATVWGIAYSLDLVETEKITFGQYAEFAHIADNGSGAILPGIYAQVKNLKVNLEYRIYGSRFTPAFFDENYEEERGSQPDPELTEFVAKEDLLRDYKPAQGFNGKIEAFLFKKVKGSFAWQNLYGRDLDTGKSVWFELWVDTHYKRLENFALAYSKTNASSMGIIHFIEPKATFRTQATFRAYKDRWFVTAKYAERYKDKDEDGHIDWLKETRRSFGLGLKYTY